MWYYAVNGQMLGPISEADLDAQVRSGVLSPGTYVWREGMSTWVPYNSRASTAAPIAGDDVLTPFGGETTDAQPVQGSRLRLESTSSWAMVAIVCIAMFGFLGVLSSRPAIAEARSFSSAGLDADESETFGATARLRRGLLTIRNNGDIDWPETSVTFDNAGTTYTYTIEGLPRDRSIVLSLSKFTTDEGRSYESALSSRGPTELDLEITGQGTATVPVTRVR